MSKSHTLARERMVITGAWERENKLHSEERQVPRRRVGHTKRTSLGGIGESMSG